MEVSVARAKINTAPMKGHGTPVTLKTQIAQQKKCKQISGLARPFFPLLPAACPTTGYNHNWTQPSLCSDLSDKGNNAEMCLGVTPLFFAASFSFAPRSWALNDADKITSKKIYDWHGLLLFARLLVCLSACRLFLANGDGKMSIRCARKRTKMFQ